MSDDPMPSYSTHDLSRADLELIIRALRKLDDHPDRPARKLAIRLFLEAEQQ
jgi:hypothetical protein